MENEKHVFSMYYFLALILIDSQLWSNSHCEQFPGYKIDTSPSVTVQRGLCVHVPCSFTVPSDVQLSISTTGTWYKVINERSLLIAYKNNLKHQTNGRFFLTGNLYSGDCSYSIEDPLPVDEGRHFFRYEDGSVNFIYQDIQPYVDVTELTDKPTISSTRLVDGEEVTLTCTSPGRCRKIRPQITWEVTLTPLRQEIYDITYRDGSRTFHSSITFTPRKSHNNSPLFCHVTFKSGVTTVEMITLNVELGINSHPVGGSKLIILLATIGPICLLLLLVLLVFFFWRKRQKKPTSAEADDTYTDLRLSDITSTYDQLKPEFPAGANVLGPDEGAANDYENVKTNKILKWGENLSYN